MTDSSKVSGKQQRIRNPLAKQQGAALLAFMLIVISAATYALLRDLNERAGLAQREFTVATAMADAKQSLIGYAARYADLPSVTDDRAGPGHLPCPDMDGDGNAEGSCADAGPTNFTIGRLPWRTLGLDAPSDEFGEVFWYAISENYRYGANKLTPLNSETPGYLSLDGTGDLVAVIIAPGEPVGGQDTRNTAPNALGNYLEGENADGDRDFTASGAGQFNDRLIAVTRRELMAAVETRVLNEARRFLAAYRDPVDGYDAYPWLSPFADPKVAVPVVTGTAGSGSVGTSLEDAGASFQTQQVQVGDVLRNLTDGSIGLVASVGGETSLTVSALYGGESNDFDEGDDYLIRPAALLGELDGTATAGSSNEVLEDAGKDFRDLKIRPGDVIEDASSGAMGTVVDVDVDTLVTRNVTAGGFGAGDSYRLRTNMGTTTGGSADEIVDTDKDFVAQGVQPGDVVENLSQGTFGVVDSVSTSSIFVTKAMFASGDRYAVSRMNGVSGTREGLLPLHQAGEAYRTAGAVGWRMTIGGGASLNVTIDPGASVLSTVYSASIQAFAQSTSISGEIALDDQQLACVWWVADTVECTGDRSRTYLTGVAEAGSDNTQLVDTSKGYLANWGVKVGDRLLNLDNLTLGGAAVVAGTATSGSSTTVLEDAGKNFNSLGITAGDFVVSNDTDGTRSVVKTVQSATKLKLRVSPGNPPDFDAGDAYSIYPLGQYGIVTDVNVDTLTYTGAALNFSAGDAYHLQVAAAIFPGSTGNTMTAVDNSNPFPGQEMQDATVPDFPALGVTIGDIVEDVTDGSFGEIVDTTGSSVIVGTLSGGTTDQFAVGDEYRIHHRFIADRRYVLTLRFKGNFRPVNDFGVRRRDVCLGYGSDCTSAPGNVDLPPMPFPGAPAPLDRPAIRIIDTDADGAELGRAELSIPDTGSPQGYLRLAGLKFDLRQEPAEVPRWFLANRWHELLYVAYSETAQPSPGGSSTCTAGTDCLVVEERDGSTSDDKMALIILAGGDELPATTPAQNRAVGRLTDYFEFGNADPTDGDVFMRFPASVSDPFNDRLSEVEPSLW